MRYLLLIANAPDAPRPASAEAAAGELQRWIDYTAALERAGILVAGEALVDPSEARTVTPATGAATDGPFAEAKETIGGFYLIDVASRDEAEAWALKMPASGQVEVRQVMVFDGP